MHQKVGKACCWDVPQQQECHVFLTYLMKEKSSNRPGVRVHYSSP